MVQSTIHSSLSLLVARFMYYGAFPKPRPSSMTLLRSCRSLCNESQLEGQTGAESKARWVLILMMVLMMLLRISRPSSNARRPHHERRHILVPLQHFLDFLQRKALLKRYIMSTIIESTSRCFQWYCASNCNRSHRHVSSGYPQGYLDCRELFGIDDGFTTGIALGCSYTIHCTTYDANTRMVS